MHVCVTTINFISNCLFDVFLFVSFQRYADANGDPVIAWYYQPDGEGGYNKSPNGPLFLWGQAVFVIAQLLTSGLLHINELDIIRRYLPSYNRPRKGGRYSAFQVKKISFAFFCNRFYELFFNESPTNILFSLFFDFEWLFQNISSSRTRF